MLKSKTIEFKAIDSGDEPFLKQLQNNCPVKSKLTLKIGAQVISNFKTR